MLERVLQMDAPPTRRAWAWHDLGRVLGWTRAPRSEVERAFQSAVDLLPGEPRFLESLKRVQESR